MISVIFPLLLGGLGSALKHLDKLSAPQRPFPIYICTKYIYTIISIMIVLSDTQHMISITDFK